MSNDGAHHCMKGTYFAEQSFPLHFQNFTQALKFISVLVNEDEIAVFQWVHPAHARQMR